VFLLRAACYYRGQCYVCIYDNGKGMDSSGLRSFARLRQPPKLPAQSVSAKFKSMGYTSRYVCVCAGRLFGNSYALGSLLCKVLM